MTVQTTPGQPSKIADPGGTELSHGDWTWIRTSIFMRWSNCHNEDQASVTLVIFSASPELRARFQRLWSTDLSAILVDPFSLFVICLDELWLQAMIIVNIIGDVYGKMERVSHFEQSKPSGGILNSGSQSSLELANLAATESSDVSRLDFVGLHNMAKHIIHLKEGADAASLTMGHLQKFHQELIKEPPQGQGALPAMRLASQMLGQKAVQFEVWKLRINSLEQRMQNIINLVKMG